MFKKIFIDLCNKKGISPTRACNELGLSAATFSCWTDESVPRRATLQRMADYFGVSVNYLLGNEQPAPSIAGIARNGKNNAPIDPDAIAKAFAGGVTVSVGEAPGASSPAIELWRKISRLDEIDRAKADAFVSGLLAAEKYQEPTQKLKIAARGSGIKELTVTDSQLQELLNLPEVTDLDDLS